MDIKTGNTVYDNILSVNSDGLVVTAGTISSVFYINGATGNTPTLTLGDVDPNTGIFVASFTPTLYGMHQFVLSHSETGMRYVSQVYNVKPAADTDVTVYVGI